LTQKYIDGNMLKKMIIRGAEVLRQNKSIVDSLNVFPVPDGDTGTNMSLTMTAAVDELKKADVESVSDVARKAANGSLMGARGNSGVILSQLFRGFSKKIEGKKKLNAVDFAVALKNGADMAYKAVMKPIEGTILTVFREGSDHAVYVARKGYDVIKVLQEMIKKSEEVLEKTPEILPVLKEAGVVDAGGKGFVYILKGALEALKGCEWELEDTEKNFEKRDEDLARVDVNTLKYLYCTEAVVYSGNLRVDRIKEFLKTKGDSIVVVEADDKLFKIHIHTNNPGDVLNFFTNSGELKRIKVENMKEQHESNFIKSPNDNTPKTPEKNIGIIAVALGEGIKNIMKSLGVDEIIEGGQTMNPSTQDIARAIEKIDAEEVLILPNNKNIIMAAEQAAKISDKRAGIVRTQNVAEGITALLYFNDEVSLEDNIQNMENNLKKVITGQLTFAVRDSTINGLKIKKGNVIGISNNEIRAAGENVEEVFLDLLKSDINEYHEILTIFYGKDISKERAEKLVEKLEEIYSHLEIELHFGGQPLYYYLYSLE